MPKSAKAFGFRGASPPDQGLCPWTPLGALPPDPRYIGSRYRARHVSEPSHFSLRSDAYGAVTGRTARCRCKFRYLSNFTTASRGFPATARLSCCSLPAECSESSENYIRSMYIVWFLESRTFIGSTLLYQLFLGKIIDDSNDNDTNIHPKLTQYICNDCLNMTSLSRREFSFEF